MGCTQYLTYLRAFDLYIINIIIHCIVLLLFIKIDNIESLRKRRDECVPDPGWAPSARGCQTVQNTTLVIVAFRR